MIVVFIYPFTIILIHTALLVLQTSYKSWAKHLATWILRSVACHYSLLHHPLSAQRQAQILGKTPHRMDT